MSMGDIRQTVLAKDSEHLKSDVHDYIHNYCVCVSVVVKGPACLQVCVGVGVCTLCAVHASVCVRVNSNSENKNNSKNQ